MLRVELKSVKLPTTILLVHLMELLVDNVANQLFLNKELKVTIVLATLPI